MRRNANLFKLTHFEQIRFISNEVPHVISKATEFFITELTRRAWFESQIFQRKTIKPEDIATGATKSEIFDFLIDFLPEDLNVDFEKDDINLN
ncbi:nuclear transcription factor y subunit gamma [Anaeramoeba ignava]|uniref:Nuclear transcription factor y subunit gamma n=1 Tax=Anaeramoeba ignava TaxID=1746090 RepID=A0A9Q0LF52_ANAIG|nr:nuclear transcription factor y subunit gamma [Anaeramoeba ignava]